MTKLDDSLDIFKNKLKNTISDCMSDVDDLDDYEFGSWDHMWLSMLILTWLKDLSPDGVNSMFMDVSDASHDMRCDDNIEEAKLRQKKAYDSLIRGFEELSRGQMDAGGDSFNSLMDDFKKLYATMWD